MGDTARQGAGLSLLSAERAAFLNDTQTEFARWVQKGDAIECGLDGDMLQAYQEGEARPTGVITKLKRFGEMGVSLRVLLDGSNQVIEIPVGTTEPSRVWQPTQATFERMQHRAMQAGMANMEAGVDGPADLDGPAYRGAAVDDPAYRGADGRSIEKLELALAGLQNSLSALSSEVTGMRQPAPPAAPLGMGWDDPGSDSDASSVGGPATAGTFHFASDMSSDSEDGY
jgi:hypothetical protein